jgi:hypothetical protein
MTLEEVLKKEDGGSIRESLESLFKAAKDQDKEKLDTFVATLKDISEVYTKSTEVLMEKMDLQAELLRKILGRPDPKFPEPLPFPEQKDFPAFPEFPKYPEPKDISPLLGELIEVIRNEHQATREVLDDILNKEPEYHEPSKEPLRPAVNMGSVHKHSRWTRASTAQGNIVGAFDGMNNIFRLPSAPIINSETVRLNGGTPLETDDYTIVGNTITFTVVPVAGSTMEIRYNT